jgi:hypothetical protein
MTVPFFGPILSECAIPQIIALDTQGQKSKTALLRAAL